MPKIVEPACIVDLETGGTRPGCRIFTVGAVMVDLNTGDEISSFYESISVDDNHGELESGTMIWWSKQHEMARNACFDHKSKLTLFEVLEQFSDWYREYGGETVWGNGATFDISMLEFHFNKYSIRIPWNYWAVRDLRTLEHLVGKDLKRSISFEGIKHHSLHDAFHEAKIAAMMWQKAKEALNER